MNKRAKKAYNKRYYRDNKAYFKKYREDHRERLKIYFKKYRQENRERLNAYKEKYYQDHKKRLIAYQKKYYQDHKEQYRQYFLNWYLPFMERVRKNRPPDPPPRRPTVAEHKEMRGIKTHTKKPKEVEDKPPIMDRRRRAKSRRAKSIGFIRTQGNRQPTKKSEELENGSPGDGLVRAESMRSIPRRGSLSPAKKPGF